MRIRRPFDSSNCYGKHPIWCPPLSRCSKAFNSAAPITALSSLRERAPSGEFFAAVQFRVRCFRGTSHMILMRLHGELLHMIATVALSTTQTFNGAQTLVELPGGDLLCATRKQLEFYCLRRLLPRANRLVRFSRTLTLAEPLLDLCSLCCPRFGLLLAVVCHAEAKHSMRLYAGLDGGAQTEELARWRRSAFEPQRAL